MAGPDTSLYILTGPTASGKTQMALEWAEREGAEIISCDAFLVYQGMDIGTAKPSKAELLRVPHHLVNCLSLKESFTVQDYISRVQAIIPEIFKRGNKVLIVGGSAFYLKSFFMPVTDVIAGNEALRKTIQDTLEREGLEAILSQLYALNPQGLGQLDVANPRRVSRALERCMLSGKSLLELWEDFAKIPSPFAVFEKKLRILCPQPELLKQHIAQRVESMFEQGLVDEVRGLMHKGLLENPTASQAIGYKEVLAWIQAGEASQDYDSLKSAIIQNTCRLAKKQNTWIRQFFKPLKVSSF